MDRGTVGKRNNQFEVRIPVEKLDTKKGIATGWAAITTDDTWEPVIDHDDEYIPIAEIEKAAHQAFLEHGPHGVVGDMHKTTGHGSLVESMVVDREKRKALGFGDPPQGSPAEGWAVSFRIDDPGLAKDIRVGEKLELSIRGTAERMKLSDWEKSRGRVSKCKKSIEPYVLLGLELNSTEIFSVVDQGASGNRRVSPRIVLFKRRSGIMGILSKFFKSDGKLRTQGSIANDPLTNLREALDGVPEETRDGVLKVYGHQILKMEGSPQAMLEQALAGLPEDKIAAIMAAFQLALQAPASKPEETPTPEPKAPEPPKPENPGQKPDEDEMAKVVKALTHDGRKILEKVLEDNRAKDDVIKELSGKVDGEIAKRREREAVEKAKQLPAIPGEQNETVRLLVEAEDKLSESGQETLAKILQSSNALIMKGGVTPKGSIGSGGSGATALQKANEIAKSRIQEVRKSGNQILTFEQVLDDVWKENPDLYKQYCTEQEARD